MSEVRISLNNIRNVKTVFIEDLGAFTVRKLGAGEELDLSDKLRRLNEILKELREIDFSKYDVNKKDDLAEIEKLTEKAESLTKEVSDIQRFELDTFKRCLTDDAGGKNVDLLMNTLSIEERANFFKSVFEPTAVVEAPETASNPEAEVNVVEEPEVPQAASKQAKKGK